jgi:hypothetical protein
LVSAFARGLATLEASEPSQRPCEGNASIPVDQDLIGLIFLNKLANNASRYFVNVLCVWLS